MSLLSAAAYYNNEEIINFLLDFQADMHPKDEIGGPILAALSASHHALALSLAQRGLDTNLKDDNQMTALDFLNSYPRLQFDVHCKPLFKLLSGATNPIQ